MAIDLNSIFSNMGTTTWLLILIIFVLFVLSMKKVLKIVMNTVWIILAAFLFPTFMNRVLGLAVPADMDSIIMLAVAGVGLYFIYLVAKSVYGLLGAAEKFGKKIAPSMPKIEGKPKKEDKKAGKAEKPKKGEPVPPQYFAKTSKKNKDPFRDYVVIGDVEEDDAKSRDISKSKASGRTADSSDDYAELGGLKEEKGIDLDEEEKGFKEEEKVFEEEEKEFLKSDKIRVKEIKFRKKRKK